MARRRAQPEGGRIGMFGDLLDRATHVGASTLIPSIVSLLALYLAGVITLAHRRFPPWAVRRAEVPRDRGTSPATPDHDRSRRLFSIGAPVASEVSVDPSQSAASPARPGSGDDPGPVWPEQTYLQTIIRSVPITLFAVDRDGRFTFADGHGLAPLGWQPGEMLDWTAATIAERLPGLTEALPRAVAGESGTMTWVVHGEVFDVHYAPLVAPTGEVAGVTGVAINVSERVRQEEEIRRQAEELHAAYEALQRTQAQVLRQERLYALGTMASGIVHNLNNTLTAVLGYTELLLQRSQVWEDPAVVEKYLGLIQRSSKEAARILARLRDFYRPAQGVEPSTTVDLVDVVDQAIDLTRPRWHDQASLQDQVIEVVKDLAPVPPVEGHSAELRDALTNLIFNAVEAIPAAGTIAFQTRCVEERVLLTIADTGVGMSEEVRRRCFDPFFTTKNDRGVGLGLSTVYGVVRRYGGTIDVDSTPGHGTTFTISLPVYTPAPPSLPHWMLDHPPNRILLIDDDDGVRELVSLYLSSDGHLVETGVDGPDGLARFQPERFDLVIVDRSAAGVGGDRIALTIKERSPATPVLMLTGYGDLMEAQSERPPGVDLVVSKPITPDALRAAVTSLTWPPPTPPR
jgi:PAS domain S-box-containing protein